MSLKITIRQQEVLAYIRAEVRNGLPPTRAEIAEIFGWKSANTAEDHLRALERKGHLRLIPGASRGIQLRGMETCPCCGGVV